MLRGSVALKVNSTSKIHIHVIFQCENHARRNIVLLDKNRLFCFMQILV